MKSSFRGTLRLAFSVMLCIAGTSAFATSFVVPSDAELIRKSDAVIRGVVSSSRVIESETGVIETVYEIAITRRLKGDPPEGTFISVKSPGGRADERFLFVESAAHFADNEEVLLFLTLQGGNWTPTDMTLGKFRPALTSKGYGVLVRDDEDITGLDDDGRPHIEKVRLEDPFMRFIEGVVRGEERSDPYEVDAAEVIARGPAGRSVMRLTERAVFPAETYSTQVVACDDSRYGTRWPTPAMDAGVRWFRSNGNALPDTLDAGRTAVQAALLAWTSDGGSAVNLADAGAVVELVANDGKNVIVFNDPQDVIAGKWSGSGVVATTFVYGYGSHDFDGGRFLDIVGADIVFQDGYAADDPRLSEAITHELGHTIGLRHSDRHSVQACTGEDCANDCTTAACDPAVEECSSTSIMSPVLTTTHRSGLQAWDTSAAHALYPATNAAPNPPTNVQAVSSSELGVYVSWSGSDGATSYSVYRSDGGPYVRIGVPNPPAATSFLDEFAAVGSSYLYAVKAHNASGESDFSGSDIAVRFTDPALTAGMTIRAVHLTELRSAANLMLASAGWSAPSYTDPTIVAGTTIVQAVHFQEVEDVLRTAKYYLGLSVPAPIGIASGSLVPASHITTLRSYAQ